MALILQDGTLITQKSHLERKMWLIVILYPIFHCSSLERLYIPACWHMTCSALLCGSSGQRNANASDLCQFEAKAVQAITTALFLFSFHHEKGMSQLNVAPSVWVPDWDTKLTLEQSYNQNILWESNKLVFLSYWDFWGPFH